MCDPLIRSLERRCSRQAKQGAGSKAAILLDPTKEHAVALLVPTLQKRGNVALLGTFVPLQCKLLKGNLVAAPPFLWLPDELL